MFEVTISTINNPFKNEIVDSTTIVLRQKEPFVQMSYKYDGDFSELTDEKAIEKVLEDFYQGHYQDKERDNQLTKLELDIAKLKEQNEAHEYQNDLLSDSVIELTETLLSLLDDSKESPEEAPVEEEIEEETTEADDEEIDTTEESGVDDSDSDADGDTD